MLSLIALCAVLLAATAATLPLFLSAANRPLGRGLESDDPLDRWQQEKNRLTAQLRDNDVALAEGRLGAAAHDLSNRRLSSEAEAALTALRRARDAFGPARDVDLHRPGKGSSAVTAVCVVLAAFGVNRIASMNDMDMRGSPHMDGGIPIEGAAAMPVDTDGAPDIAQMVARLESRVFDGAAEKDDYQMLLRSYDVLGLQDEAVDVLKSAAEQYPGDLDLQMSYLRAAVDAADAPPAKTLLDDVTAVIRMAPDLAEARWYRSLFLLQHARPDAARRDLEWLAERLDPGDPAHGRVRALLTAIDDETRQEGVDQ